MLFYAAVVRNSGLVRWWVATAVVVMLCPVPPARAEEPSTARPLRVLVVGDSVTQGSAGDWTWRYRLWQHLSSTGTEVDFVGPRDDLWDDIAHTQGSQDYVDPDFDRDHASRWGATLAFFPQTDQPIGQLVESYAPDVVIEMLGFNDLVFLRHEPARVADDVRGLVASARAADPDVDIVLGHLSQTWSPGVDEVNLLLDDLAQDLDDVTTRVVTAKVETGYSLREDTWDQAHPNARGETRIAAAMADALAGLGLAQPYARPLPIVPRGPRKAPVVSAAARDGAAELTWSGPPGADHEIVWLRDLTLHDDWAALPEPVAGTSVTVGGLLNGHDYALRLQPVKGYWAAEDDVRSDVVRVLPLPPPPGAVQLKRVDSPRRDRVRVVATSAPGATSYRLEVAPTRSCSSGRVRFGDRVVLTRPRATYTTAAPFVRVRMVALNAGGAGPPSAVSSCLRVH